MNQSENVELEDHPGKTMLQDVEGATEEKGKVLPQFIAGGVGNILGVILGLILGWTSPSLRHLEDPETTPIPITTDDNSWIASLMPLAAAFGPFVAGFVAQNYGRRVALLIVSLPIILAYICLAAADAVWILFLGRILSGVAIGWSFTVLPMYTSEVAEKQYRGAMGTFIQLSISFGLLLDYAIGPYTEFIVLSLVSLAFPITFLIAFWFMPESPYFLLQKNRDSEASKALQWLRAKSSAGVSNELKIMKTEVEEAARQKGGLKDIFATKANRKSLGLCISLGAFQQLSGINIVLFNAESIFARAGGSITPDVATIIVGVVMLLSAFPTPVLVEKLGRKTLLLASAIGMCISQAVLGLFFYLDEQGNDTSSYSVVAVIAVVTFLIAYSPGFGPLPWTVMGEMFPSNIKALGSTLTASATWFIGFLVTRFFNDLVEATGNSYTFWLFAVFCGIAAPFTIFLLPETKGKTIAQIQEELS